MKPKSLSRPSELVLSAIYNLNEDNGSSVQEIVAYISGNYSVNAEDIKEKVEAALKRGLSFGLISRDTCGLYKLRDVIQLPEVPPPQRAKRKRKKLVKLRKSENMQSMPVRVYGENRKRYYRVSSCERLKRPRLVSGGRKRCQGAKPYTNGGCTNGCRRK